MYAVAARFAWLAIAVAAAFAAGCSGDSDAFATIVPVASPTPTPTEPPFTELPQRDSIVPNTITENEVARQFLPALDQFPAAWRELSSGVPDEPPPETAQELNEGACPTPTVSGQTGAAFASFRNWDANHFVSWSTLVFVNEQEATWFMREQAQLRQALVDCVLAQIEGGTFCFDTLECRAGVEASPRGLLTEHSSIEVRVTFEYAAWTIPADQPNRFATGTLDGTIFQVGRSVTTYSHLSFSRASDPSAALGAIVAGAIQALETDLPPQ
jgi:hypothetical protein